MEYLQKAEADNAPAEAIQKVEDTWMLLSSIKNESNRRRSSSSHNRRGRDGWAGRGEELRHEVSPSKRRARRD